MSSTSISRGESDTGLRRAWAAAGIALALVVPCTSIAAALQATSQAPALAAAKSSGATTQSPPATPSSLLPLTATDVLTHVRHSVDWYRYLTGVEQISLPGVDPLARGQLQQEALTAVQLAFEFGKAAEDILGREAQANAQKQSPKPANGGGTPGHPVAPTMAVQLSRPR